MTISGRVCTCLTGDGLGFALRDPAHENSPPMDKYDGWENLFFAQTTVFACSQRHNQALTCSFGVRSINASMRYALEA